MTGTSKRSIFCRLSTIYSLAIFIKLENILWLNKYSCSCNHIIILFIFRIFSLYYSNSISLWVNLLVVRRWKPSKSGDLLKPSTSLYLEGKWENHACNTVIMCLKQLPNHLKKTIWLFQQWKNETANGLFFLFSKYQSGANLRGRP